MSCDACIPLDCLDSDDFGISAYSLDLLQFGPVLVCPEGFSCDPSVLKMLCCGNLITSDVRIGASPSEIAALAVALFSRCAQISLNCPGPGNPELPGGLHFLYYNRLQTCSARCPDGNAFVYSVRAGTFINSTQAAADLQAYNAACQLAAQHRICLSNFPTGACLGVVYSQTITATGGFLSDTNNLWELASGALPTGLGLSGGFAGKTITIHGTPNVAGTFTFNLKVTAPNGDVMLKQYTICVSGITQSTLPDGTVGTAYAQTLTGLSCAIPPLSWQVVSGALPPGLTLDESTGVISGTPLGPPASYNFTILIQDHST